MEVLSRSAVQRLTVIRNTHEGVQDRVRADDGEHSD